jgi:hypothetical protein
MLTNKEVIYRVRNSIKEFNKDSLLTNKAIYTVLKTVTSFLLNRESNKSKIFLQSDLWQPYCVEMIKVSSTECLDIPSDCLVWRSKNKLPKLLELDSGIFFSSISSMDGSTSFYYATASTAYSKSKLKYNKNKYVWVENGYLYSLSAYPMIKIVGYFENNLNSGCSRLDDYFRCPLYLSDAVIKMTLQEFGLFKQIPEDVVQNKNTNN